MDAPPTTPNRRDAVPRIPNHRAIAIQERQREIADARDTLDALERIRNRVGRMRFYTGMIATAVLAPLVLVNAINDAPILELFLPAPAEPWITPVGPIQPIALAVSILLVGLMGLAAVLAMSGEEAADAYSFVGAGAPAGQRNGVQPDDDAQASRPEEASPWYGEKRVRRAIAVAAMFALVLFISWGGYLRGKLGGGMDGSIAAQNAGVSALFAGLTALIEEIGVVTAVTGYLTYQAPVWFQRLKLAWMIFRFRGIVGQGVVHPTVTSSADAVDRLAQSLEAQKAEVAALDKQVSGLVPNTSAHSDATETIVARKRAQSAAMAAERDRVVTWANAFLGDVRALSADPRAPGTTLDSAIGACQSRRQGIQSKLRDPLAAQRKSSDRHRIDIRNLYDRHDSDAFQSLDTAERRLGAIRDRMAALDAERSAALSKPAEALLSVEFQTLYREPSQKATLNALAELLTRLDGPTGASAIPSASLPIERRVADFSAELRARSGRPAPPDSPIAIVRDAIARADATLASARGRLTRANDPDVIAENRRFDDLAMEIDRIFTDLDLEITAAQRALDVRIAELRRETAAARRAVRPLARLVRAIGSLLARFGGSRTDSGPAGGVHAVVPDSRPLAESAETTRPSPLAPAGPYRPETRTRAEDGDGGLEVRPRAHGTAGGEQEERATMSRISFDADRDRSPYWNGRDSRERAASITERMDT
ncbi:MAG TPA: hypothetical protein VKT77_04235 [Chthonomonadaceae bacterium]|nr:hypothetical protein [Chthonomonadaceae bacterium]